MGLNSVSSALPTENSSLSRTTWRSFEVGNKNCLMRIAGSGSIYTDAAYRCRDLKLWGLIQRPR